MADPITVGVDDVFSFRTQEGSKYTSNVNCKVNYTLAEITSPSPNQPLMELSQKSKINIYNFLSSTAQSAGSKARDTELRRAMGSWQFSSDPTEGGMEVELSVL